METEGDIAQSSRSVWQKWPPELKQQLLDELKTRRAKRVGSAFKKRYANDPVGFVRDCINWGPDEQPANYQLEILSALVERKRVAVRSPHSAGKTFIAAVIILWFALTRDGGDGDWKIAATAGAWRQLKHFLWPELHKLARRLSWPKIQRSPFSSNELLALSLKLETGEAFAVASTEPALIEGAHASSLLFIYDESKTISDATFDASEGAFASGDCYALAISTPGEPVGRFYKIHARQPGLESWWTRHITLEEAIAAGRINQDWAIEKKLLWGEQSAIYQNRVLGEFHTSDAEGVIPLAWIEAAVERWEIWNDLEDKDKWLPFTSLGVDVARSETGGDRSVLAVRHEHVISELRHYNTADTITIVGHAAGVLRARGGYGIVDVIGVGAGVFDRLREQSFKVKPFNASESPGAGVKDRSGELEFLNLRAAAWWRFRELLDPAFGTNICLPPDDKLIGDLCAPHWKMTSSGKIQIESKDEIRKRIGRSTDDGDAVVMAFQEEAVKRDRYQEDEAQTWGYRVYW